MRLIKVMKVISCFINRWLGAGALGLGVLALPLSMWASTVRVETTLGVIDIELFDTTAPATVANFLSYVQSGEFDSTFFHRSVPGFVIQGGGYVWNTSNNSVAAVKAKAPVINEFSAQRSNLRGTVAMAKLGSSPDSATSQWFVNLADNSANLDAQNGGFTVFGKVIGNGMTVVDAIAAIPTKNLNGVNGGPFDSTPFILPSVGSITAANLAMVTRVSVSGLSQAPGWNLLGNGTDAPLDVAATFSDAQRFLSIWKWVANPGVWAFYSPLFTGQNSITLADYTASKGYLVLSAIEPGEGYWINLSQTSTVPFSNGSAVTSAALNAKLLKGWNLAAVGTKALVKQFCEAQSTGVNTLWTWNNPQSKWYFYSPSLDLTGGTALFDYTASKGYLDFNASGKTLDAGMGFWVNKP